MAAKSQIIIPTIFNFSKLAEPNSNANIYIFGVKEPESEPHSDFGSGLNLKTAQLIQNRFYDIGAKHSLVGTG